MLCCYQGEPVFIVDLFIYLNEKSNFKKKKNECHHMTWNCSAVHTNCWTERGASFETFLVWIVWPEGHVSAVFTLWITNACSLPVKIEAADGGQRGSYNKKKHLNICWGRNNIHHSQIQPSQTTTKGSLSIRLLRGRAVVGQPEPRPSHALLQSHSLTAN